MQITVQILLLILGFALLVKGADWLVKGASGIAEKAGVSKLVIGLTIVAMGTSAPEAAISISASVKGSAGIAVGNVLGSNILNILVILGLTAVIVPLSVHESTIKYEIPFVFFITIIFALLGLTDNEIGRADGAILWVLFIAYLSYLYYMSSRQRARRHKKEQQEAAAQEEKQIHPLWLLLVLFVVGVAMVIIGSNVVVNAATAIARMAGISERVIGLTIVALGTSLPELVTSLTAARKKEADIAVGNIVGSNIFNLLFVIGTAALISPVAYEAKFTVDSIVAIACALLLWVCVVFHKRRVLQRWGGVIMLVGYALYFGLLLPR